MIKRFRLQGSRSTCRKTAAAARIHKFRASYDSHHGVGGKKRGDYGYVSHLLEIAETLVERDLASSGLGLTSKLAGAVNLTLLLAQV